MWKAIVAALALFIAVPAFAQGQQCGPSATLAQHLADAYGERPVFVGQTPDGSTLIFFVNDQSKTWTIAIVQGAVACLVAAGSSAEMKPMGVSL